MLHNTTSMGRGPEELLLVAATGLGDDDWDAVDGLIAALDHGEGASRREILRALREVIPHLARIGRLDHVRRTIGALEDVAARGSDPDLDELLEEISGAEDLAGAVIDSVADGSLVTSFSELNALLGSLRPTVLGPVLVRCNRASTLASALRRCAAAIIAADPDAFARLVDEETDADVLYAAMGVVGEYRVRSAEAAILRLLRHPGPRVRRGAVATALLLRNDTLLRALIPLLDDEDSEVRAETARGIGNLRYRPAARRLAAMVRGSRLRSADLSEKRVFFDAAGRMGAPEAVEALEQILSGKQPPMIREVTESRASAAQALGRARGEAARRALIGMRDAPEETVRRAARRALARLMRGGTP